MRTPETFTLSIDLGNEEMSTGSDVANALRTLAERMEDYSSIELFELDASGIRDINGNTVGVIVVG